MVNFQYDVKTRELTCAFRGQFQSNNCPAIEKAIEEKLKEISEGRTLSPDVKITFDLEHADYVSSVFLRIILMAAKKVKRGNFSLLKPNPFVKELLHSTGFDKLITIQEVNIETCLKEDRTFTPSDSFREKAFIKHIDDYKKLYRLSIEESEKFWAVKAKEHLVWFKEFDRSCEWNLPYAKWFTGGKLNACVNCLDKHLNSPVADKTAIIWEGEPTGKSEIRLTYRELYEEVCRFSNVLKSNGIKKGDRVIIYMPMVPETFVAMLSCARIGAIHSVVFGGFSSQSIAERVRDCTAKIILTADGSFRRGKLIPLKEYVDEAMNMKDESGNFFCESAEKVIVLKRASNDISMHKERDLWWHEEMDHASSRCPPEEMDSEDILFILYTSGSTGKPKGIYHSTAGYLLGTKLTHSFIFDVREDDIYWCTADTGWITGHSYGVYGPLANGTTVLLYEGAPNYPAPNRFWQIIEKYKVTVFYTAPTAIRSFMQWGDEWPKKHDLSSLRLLGTVGEPINPQAWIWYHEHIGHKKCPVVDTWWQTETGSIMISTLPGAMATKPGSAGMPFFGVAPEIVDDDGKPVPSGSGGRLVIKRPWPSMLRGVWGDPVRYEYTYWKDIPGYYSTGDSARKDKDGYLWIMGRIDDVLNVSGHRIGTAEVESALVSHPSVAEAAVVGRADDVKGSALVAFVILCSGIEPLPSLKSELSQHVASEIGHVAKPDEIRFTEGLPKTRSGKIMRRLLKQVAAGTEIIGDITTLEDFNVLAKLGAGDSLYDNRNG